MRSDDIIQSAQEAAGIEQFDSDSFREGLEIAAEALDAHPLRTEEGKAFICGMYVRNLVARLKVAEYARQHPEVRQGQIKRPVFVMGMPRTGTTLVSYLLGADPNRRSLLRWEVASPVPPPTTQTLYANPVIDAMDQMDKQLEAAGRTIKHIHYEAPAGPTECTFVMAHDFKSLFVESMSARREYSEWFLACDLTSAYEYHRLFLQVLQSKAPGVWSLKLPSHTLGVRVLRQMYPDARVIWTHRDPYKSAGSLMSMIAKAEKLSLRQSDIEHIRTTYPHQLAEHLRRPMAVMDEEAQDPFHHVFYAELVRDPIGVMRKLYAALGDDFTPEAEAGMRAWLAANPQGVFGKHAYGLDEFGLTKADLTPHFEDYLARFDVETEEA